MAESQFQFPGRIVLERVRNTRPIRSFIVKKISNWLNSHGLSNPAGDLSYDVAVNRSTYGHLFTCRIELHTRGEVAKRAIVTESDLHQAILSALNHLERQMDRGRRTTYALTPA